LVTNETGTPDPVPSSKSEAYPRWVLRLAVLLMLLGAALRAAPFLDGRSLWCDEAKLAVNVLDRSLPGLFASLDYGQVAPVGFLLLAKGLVAVFGGGEQVLRVVPLVASLAALPLLWTVVRGRLPAGVALSALAIFAVHGDSIYFGSEFKQYATDVAIALGATAVLIRWGESDFDRSSTLWMRVVAFCSIWFSFPSALIIGPGLVWYWLTTWRGRQWVFFKKVSGILALWATSLLLLRLSPVGSTMGSDSLHDYWAPGFLPSSSWSAALNWVLDSPWRIMRWPLGLMYPGLALVLVVTGVGWIALNRGRMIPFLIGPVLAAFLAGALHLYPFGGHGGRTVLFLVPYLIVLLVAPLAWAPKKTEDRWLLLPLLIAAISIMIYPSGKVAVSQLRVGFHREEIWPVLRKMQVLLEAGDRVYVYHGSRSPFLYYRRRLDLDQVQLLEGKVPEREGEPPSDLRALLGGGRLWFIASWGCNGSVEEAESIVSFLGHHGRRVIGFEDTGAMAVLFDLTTPPDPASPPSMARKETGPG